MARRDGLLTHELSQDDPRPRDACGLMAVWAPGVDVATVTAAGLLALQHRGQESAGIAVCSGDGVVAYKDLGLVAQVFDAPTLASLLGHAAIGHCRYSTFGAPSWENAQPAMTTTDDGEPRTLALAHNGNIVNLTEFEPSGGDRWDGMSDSHLLTLLLAEAVGGRPIFESAGEFLARLRGAFSLVFMDDERLYAARDAHGLRPLTLGRIAGGWIVASETAALDTLDATVVRDVAPGELLMIDENGVSSSTFAAPRPAACIFEHVYLARPDSVLGGQQVYRVRVDLGRRLARRHPVDADLVVGVPDSGEPASIGFATEAELSWGLGFARNMFVGRAFIEPDDVRRRNAVSVKINPLREAVRGRRVVVVDDSIVRGNTQRTIVRMLRESGATEVHVRVSSAPITWPCFYGVDIADPVDLISAGMAVDEVRRSIGADSLGYNSVEDMVQATGQVPAAMCTGCFTGQYPST
jgi:amidophosphoribosyltransferase